MKNQKDSLCWECRKAVGGCSWSREGRKVKRARVEKKTVKYGNRLLCLSIVARCPEFVKG